MLSDLIIKDFAIIEHLEIAFEEGLTVLTGETGAGKSIIIDALNLLLGGRASTDVIRTGSDRAAVEGVFRLQDTTDLDAQLDAIGIDPCEGGNFVVRRQINRNGRNKIFLNGSASTLAVLGNLTEGLVDISGQHEHISLLDRERHLDLLDAFASLAKERSKYETAYQKLIETERAIASISGDIRDRLNRIDYLKFQLEEIDAAEIVPGEVAALESEFKVLSNAEKIAAEVEGVLDALHDDNDSATVRIVKAKNQLTNLGQLDSAYLAHAKRIEEANILVGEVIRELQHTRGEVENNPQRLDDIQSRLEALKHLQRKHGGDLDHVLKYAESMRKELHSLESAEEQTTELEARRETEIKAALKIATGLSKKRQKKAVALSKAVETELAELNMARTQFVVSFGEPGEVTDDRGCLRATGVDDVTFLVSPNIGEEPKPLAKIASGGEMSRLMLAIKTVHADKDAVSTYVFDEVDTGIGGQTADKVGEKLAATAAGHQVLCITHLPQIASRGDHQFLVKKLEQDGRTQTTIVGLNQDERVEEIARMLSGSRVTDKTREAAQEMLRG